MKLNLDELTAVLCGAAATMSGVAVARFAYTTLLPAIIQNGWFSERDAAVLGAVNLVGYALGALGASLLVQKWGSVIVIRLAAAVVFITTLGVAWPFTVEAYGALRFVCGVAGGVLMAGAPPVMLASIRVENRRLAGACIFSGIGVGILLSSLMAPLVKYVNLSLAWFVVSVLALFSYLLLQFFWQRLSSPQTTCSPVSKAPVSAEGLRQHTLKKRVSFSVLIIFVAYGLDAFGYIPHTVFWVDFLHRKVGYSVEASSVLWALFGLGAVCGPFLVGIGAQRVGFEVTLMAVFAIKGFAILLPAVSTERYSVLVSSFVVGALVPGLVAAVSGRLTELSDVNSRVKMWGVATALFACTQGGAAYFYAILYVQKDGAFWSFVLGGGALILGMILLILMKILAVFSSKATFETTCS